MSMIDCREAVHRMWAYLSQGLESAGSTELEEHLDVCQRCCGELEFSRALRERMAASDHASIPPRVRTRLVEVLREGAGPEKLA